ncbi:hypothetical protein M3D75_01750 [Microbacterium enclense]|nr:hypothetical protein [Microbacterium enclense]
MRGLHGRGRSPDHHDRIDGCHAPRARAADHRSRARRRRWGRAGRLRHRWRRVVPAAEARGAPGQGIRGGRREAPDPQAGARPRRRPRGRDPERPGRRGHAAGRREARRAGQRLPQHRDARVGRGARGDHPGRRPRRARLDR